MFPQQALLVAVSIGAAAASEPSLSAPAAPRKDLVPDDALVVVVGGATAIGHELIRSILNAGHGWKVRVLLESPAEERSVTSEFEAVETVVWQGSPHVQLELAFTDAAAVFIISESAAGKGGIRLKDVASLVEGLRKVAAPLRRITFLSSHGVERTDRLPYSLQNLLGSKLDKLRTAEQEVRLLAMAKVPSFSVLRVGKLQAAVEADPRCELYPGDVHQGAIPLSAASAVLLQTLTRNEAVNASFSATPVLEGELACVASEAPEKAFWDDQWLRLHGPEIYRKPMPNFGAQGLDAFLRRWAQLFLRPGHGVTTKLAVSDIPGGVKLRFKAGVDEPSGGALNVVAEVSPCARVRVFRSEMFEGTIVKVMSEETILNHLEKDLGKLEGGKTPPECRRRLEAAHPADPPFDDPSTDVSLWVGEWQQRVACWAEALPAPTRGALGGCMHTLGHFLREGLEHAHQAWLADQQRPTRDAGVQPPATGAQPPAAAALAPAGCRFISEGLALPDFPPFGGFDFAAPPLSQLLPWGVQKWQELEETPPLRSSAVAEPRLSQRESQRERFVQLGGAALGAATAALGIALVGFACRRATGGASRPARDHQQVASTTRATTGARAPLADANAKSRALESA